jgi:hypothetical protein
MRDQATLTVWLRDEYSGETSASSKLIAGPFVECFEPIDVCSSVDTSILMRLVGKNAHTAETARVVRKRREKYAKILAEEIAKEIVEFMESKDMRDGYRKD